jgi:hypothetical protein
MFKLIAYLFIAVNGVPAKTPTITLASKHLFASQEACMNYFNTPDGNAAKDVLKSIMSAQKVKYKIGFKCLKTEEETI